MSHYYSPKQDSPLNLSQFTVSLGVREYTFYSGSGVFSKKKIDFGTNILVKNMQIRSTDRVLDLGCGIGIVGRVAADMTKGDVVLTDINSRAVKLAKMNTRRLKNVKVVCGDMYEKVSGNFDVVLLNPPQTAGKKVCMEMMSKAKDYLTDKGSLQVVARHNKGGKTLSLFMLEVYGNMETLVRQGGYRVYKSVKE
jgi:16S rRNA (guanine1207-N2)-methyltransferase